MVQHIIVTWTENGVQAIPQAINIWRDDQLVCFSLGPETEWEGDEPVVFNRDALPQVSIEPWPGTPAVKQENNTYLADARKILDTNSTIETYSVMLNVRKANTTGKQFVRRHDPEIYNQPQP